MEDGALDVSGIDSGRWGEVEIEKGPVDLFPTEPTDEDRQVEETLNSGFKGLLGIENKKRPRRLLV